MANHEPPPSEGHEPSPVALGCLGVLGAILLLPGLCSVLFAPSLLLDPNIKLGGLGVWAAGIILGALGAFLITKVIRALIPAHRDSDT
jgi:hypothetical protein